MSASLKTQNYELPLYAANDITSWLIDFNDAMTKIDSDMANIQSLANSADADVKVLTESVDNLNTSVINLNNNVTSLNNDITRINNFFINKEWNITRSNNVSSSRGILNCFYNGALFTYKASISLSSTITPITFNNTSFYILGSQTGNLLNLTPSNVSSNNYLGQLYYLGRLSGLDKTNNNIASFRDVHVAYIGSSNTTIMISTFSPSWGDTQWYGNFTFIPVGKPYEPGN